MKNKLIQLAIFTLLSITLNAQITWEKLIIPDSVIRPNGIVEIDDGVLVLSSGQGILKSIDNGENWYGVSEISADNIEYNPRNETIYTGNQVSFDLGETWTETAPIFSYNITILVNNDVVMSGTNLIVRRSIDGTQYDTLYNPMETELRFCKVVEDAEGYLYTGTYAYLGGGGMYRSDDYGESWDIISWDNIFVDDLAIGPDNALYAARYGGYSEPWGGGYKSQDFGQTWTQIQEGDLAARAIVVLPDNTVFIGASSYGTYGGVYQIKPNGNEEFVNEGLIQDDVAKLHLSPYGRLYANVYSHGTDKDREFYRTIEPVYVGQNEIGNSSKNISIYPNPANNTIYIKNSKNSFINYSIYSSNGQCLQKGQLMPDETQIDVSNLNPDIYFIQINSRPWLASYKIIKN